MTKTSAELSDIRELLGLSQEQMAERLGSTQPTISRYESGSDIPKKYFMIAARSLATEHLTTLQ